ncbi:MAG: PIG-L family deacetylase [Clostridia bacterium]|nr:PIG-L family deacetylase [Clostridia bacterium]
MLSFLMIGAHPDDMDFQCGGLAILLKRRGHIARFLSMTNGNSGHQSMSKEDLRIQRAQERILAGKEYGVVYDTLDEEDGYLTANLDTRDKLLRYIRSVDPDVIITHRTNDYHPDHRATGQLVNDCSYLIRVPLVCQDTPAMKKTPVILSCEDQFSFPVPFRADIGVNCDDVIEQKIRGALKHESQLYEWLPYDGNWTEVLQAETREEKTALVTERLKAFFSAPVEHCPQAFRPGVRYGEAFQIDEYGGQMTDEILSAMTGNA